MAEQNPTQTLISIWHSLEVFPLVSFPISIVSPLFLQRQLLVKERKMYNIGCNIQETPTWISRWFDSLLAFYETIMRRNCYFLPLFITWDSTHDSASFFYFWAFINILPFLLFHLSFIQLGYITPLSQSLKEERSIFWEPFPLNQTYPLFLL